MMKKICWFLLICGGKATAQMAQADLFITGATQPVYISMDAVKNNKVSWIRETEYEVDSVKQQPDMNKIKKIAVYKIAYLGKTPLLLQEIAVLGSDTNKLVREINYRYNPANGLLLEYKSVSSEVFDMASGIVIERDAKGLVTGKTTVTTFDFKQTPTRVTYKVICTTGANDRVRSAIFQGIDNGKEKTDRLTLDYDAEGRLTTRIVDYENKSNDRTMISYQNGDRVKQRISIYTRKITEYKPGTDPAVAFGIVVPGSAPSEITKLQSDTSTSTYGYDAKGNLTSYVYSYKNMPTTKVIYGYSAAGLLETEKAYNSFGKLKAFKAFMCK
jgi:hypothetical protein